MILSNLSCDDELCHRKKALKDAILCIGWMKILSVVCYITLYFFVHAYSEGTWSTSMQIMICLTIPFLIIHAILLFLGALEDKLLALDISLWMCLIIAAYNTVLGLIGAVYFIRVGFVAMHFLLAAVFALLALSLLTVICHDVIIVYSYKQILKAGEENTCPKFFRCYQSKNKC